jgi:GT2 family glycosyltransferase
MKQKTKHIYEPVSIVMPVLNNLAWTKKCIDSLYSHINERQHEFLIIDNNSNDGTKEYLEKTSILFPQIKVITNKENIGVGASWNQGIKFAKYDYVCIINNDILFNTNDWLYELQATLKVNKNTYWASPKTCYNEDFSQISFNPTHYEQLQYGRDRRRYVVACCFMCPKEIFQEKTDDKDREHIGLFDEQFEVKYYEDLDFIARILSQGKKVRMCDKVLIYHGVGKTSLITKGGDDNENYYQKKWGGTKYDILAMQPGRAKKGIKHFPAK